MNLGLVNGLSGEALRLFLTEQEDHKKQGQDILNIIAENIFAYENYNFENGIVGFGWLISFLHQEKYIKINSDEILEDFDDQIYKIALSYLGENQISIDDLLGLVNYFLVRHRNVNLGELYFRKFVHSECLNLIFNYFIQYMEACNHKESITHEEFIYCCKILLKCGYYIEYIYHKALVDKIVELHIYYIHFLEKKVREVNHPERDKYVDGLLYLLLSVKQRKYKILEERLHLIRMKLNISLLDYFIGRVCSDNKLSYSSLDDSELIFVLTNCIKQT